MKQILLNTILQNQHNKLLTVNTGTRNSVSIIRSLKKFSRLIIPEKSIGCSLTVIICTVLALQTLQYRALTFETIGALSSLCTQGVGRANFDIFEALYGQTDRDVTFLKNRFEISILDLTITFDILVPIPSSIWLTAVKHVSPGFYQRNKDPRAEMEKY